MACSDPRPQGIDSIEFAFDYNDLQHQDIYGYDIDSESVTKLAEVTHDADLDLVQEYEVVPNGCTSPPPAKGEVKIIAANCCPGLLRFEFGDYETTDPEAEMNGVRTATRRDKDGAVVGSPGTMNVGLLMNIAELASCECGVGSNTLGLDASSPQSPGCTELPGGHRGLLAYNLFWFIRDDGFEDPDDRFCIAPTGTQIVLFSTPSENLCSGAPSYFSLPPIVIDHPAKLKGHSYSVTLEWEDFEDNRDESGWGDVVTKSGSFTITITFL